jgi:hypothetical protein
MPNRYLACIDCVYNKGEWSFPNGAYPCGQTACIKLNNDISASDYQKKLDWAESQDWNLIYWVAKYVGGKEYTININGVRFAVRDFDDFKDEFFKLIAKHAI